MTWWSAADRRHMVRANFCARRAPRDNLLHGVPSRTPAHRRARTPIGMEDRNDRKFGDACGL